jgi:iron complex outermembrane recepter protein
MAKRATRRPGVLGGALAAAAGLTTAGMALAQQQPSGGTGLEEIVVTADRADSFGADFVQAGTFRNALQIDTPLTVSVISETLLKSQQANGLLDALRNSAGVTSSQINTSVYSNLAIRGIIVENRGNYRLNGTLPVINLIDMPLENKYRVEALKGASALYYGFTTPAGIINLTSKRPTEDPYLGVKVAGNQHGQAVGSFDVSDTWGNFGTRINAAYGSQDTGVERVDGDRKFLAGAFDWRVNDNFVLQLDAEYIRKAISEPTIVQLNTTGPFAFVLPPFDDPERNVGAEWMKSDSEERNLLLHAQWKLTPTWAVSLDVGESHLDRFRRFSTFLNYNITTGAGTVSVDPLNRVEYRNRMARAELAGAFPTGPFQHQIVFGYSKNVREIFTPVRTAQTFTQNYYNPVELPFRAFPDRVVTNPSEIDDAGYYVFDRIEYSEWLQLLAGVRRSDYEETSLLGAPYTADPTTPSFGIVVKPRSWMSVYATYIEGLESGGTAPAGSVNAGDTLPASISEQYEGGIKVEPRKGFLLTLAYFDIDRASAFVNPATRIFVQDGRVQYKGIELSATGEITPDLSLYVSAMDLDAKQGAAANAAVVGKRPDNTPERTYSAFAEYRLPFVPGAAISAGVFYTGDRAVNATNQAFAPSYTTYDVGASYATEIGGTKTSFRINAENVTGERYWAATGSGFLAPGLPRQIKFSIETIL